VIFRGIEGIEELNDGKPRKIKSIKSKFSFVIDEDTSTYGKYIRNGICIEKKVPKVISYSTFEKNLIEPIIDENIQCENIPTILSLIYATQKYFNEKKSLSDLNSEEQSKLFMMMQRLLMKKIKKKIKVLMMKMKNLMKN